ncbi:hypothetical protein HAX54_050130 [Datura stramonium]|uniref:Uncharacterized protein n=1 Tax=Datura stramonium TaxID=4076 RepID=A0ABS8SWH4_DATST|nr:hypothetical protein [Datura stramonium]
MTMTRQFPRMKLFEAERFNSQVLPDIEPQGIINEFNKILQISERRKSGKISRDRNRDVSKKVARRMKLHQGGEVMMYDQRLFNQDKGMGSGFATTDDAYNIYDKSLFTHSLSTLYRPKKDVDSDVYDEKQQTEKIAKTDRFKPDTTFVGTSERAGPVEFEADPFGLDQL